VSRTTKSRRLLLPTPQVCRKRCIDAAKNSGALRDVATAAANLGHYGAAVALEILALEEAAKAQALGMRAMLATLHDIEVPTEGLQDVLQREHTVRHRFAAWQLFNRELVRITMDQFEQQLTQGPPAQRIDAYRAAAAAVLKKSRWLKKADGLKKRGLYVDPHGGTIPARLGRADYDEAVAIVEPYVTTTLQQTGLLPKPPKPRRPLGRYIADDD
jgi:AbiV family abortive infection protein